MPSNLKRGVFINTSKMICSIHESGADVYGAIASGDGFEIDYYSIDMIDIGALEVEGRVKLRDSGIRGAKLPQEHYDFWIFNWHFTTMAIDLAPSVIAALNGPKFTIVLELAPGDPLRLVPPGVFDAYIALDPDARATQTIYPFPRPFDVEPRTVNSPTRQVPVIGSFGFATPGKGFEAVVQAVNTEFERAIVRINVPHGDFIDTDYLHGRDYASYMEDLCKRLAKPGVDVEFTRDFMTSDQLVSWCSENDLNCFLYTRCQPGLAATTDQAILSGRPLLTSSNDTFRHVLRYLDPYPLISLRGAIETHAEKVRALQRDWSQEAFNARFARLLADFQILDEARVPAIALGIPRRARRKILVCSAHAASGGILDRAQRIANALARTGEYIAKRVHCANAKDIAVVIDRERPDGVIAFHIPDASASQLSRQLGEFKGLAVLVQPGREPREDLSLSPSGIVEFGDMPIVPYFTVAHGLDSDPTIWLIGFSADLQALEETLWRVSRELPGVRVRIQLLPDAQENEVSAVNAVLSRVPRVWAETHMPAPDGEAVINTFASAMLVMVKNVDGYSDFLRNQAELAMVIERPVVFSREAPFELFESWATTFEGRHLSELVALENAAQAKLIQQFSEGGAFARLHRVFGPALQGDGANGPATLDRLPETSQAQRIPGISAAEETGLWAEALVAQGQQPNGPAETIVDTLAASDDILFLEDAFQRYLGRKPDPTGTRHYLGRLASGVSKRKIARDIKRSREAQHYRHGRGMNGNEHDVLRNLLALDGAAFVSKAYCLVLGRAADPAGLAHHLTLLNVGFSKEAVLTGLYRSSEREQTGANLVGLERLVNKHERSKSIPWRWFVPNKNRDILERSLNVTEQRMVVLEERSIQEKHRHEEAMERMREQVLHLESAVALARMEAEIGFESSELGSQQAAPLVFGRHEPGTVHILLGLTGQADTQTDAQVSIARTLQAEGRATRFVEWDPSARKIVFASRETLQAGPWAELNGVSLDQYPQRELVKIVVDEESVDPLDWLLVCGSFRLSDHHYGIAEVDLIIESRRIGLENVFVFQGAGALSKRYAEPDAVSDQKQYMQALLLADGLIATSDTARDELEHFFSVDQRAERMPPLQVVKSAECVEAKARDDVSIVEALDGFRRHDRHITCTILVPTVDETSAQLTEPHLAALGEGFRKLGIAVRSANAKIVIENPDVEIVPPNIDESLDLANWLIVPALGASELDAIMVAASSRDFRVAVLLNGDFLHEDPKAARSLAAALSKADKIVCATEAVSMRLWEALLGIRERFPCATDRVAVVRLSSANAVDPNDGYARRLAQLLALDRPEKLGVRMGQKDWTNAQRLMPQMSRRPKLSLCISTYNRAKWLDKNLQNIFSQVARPRDDLEVLVVDNCSTDHTPEIGKKYQHRPDFKFIRNSVNVGMLGNLAVTSQVASGEYIWILGDDDLTRPGAIDRIIEILNRYSDLELIYMNYGYTDIYDPDQIESLSAFLDNFNVLQPSGPDEHSTVAQIAAKTENFYTAIYSHVYRRDHAMRSYCQDTSGRIFSTMRACIPTTYYVLHYMAQSPAYWLGEQQIVVNSNVSWADYGPMLELEHLPAAWDLAERAGCPIEQVDVRRANRLWLVEKMWRNLFENDSVGNAHYISPSRTIMRLRHLPEFEKYVPEFREIYAKAHDDSHPAAALPPSVVFAAF